MPKKTAIIGSQTLVSFPKSGIKMVPAKIDTGADASSIWATNVKEKNGQLSFTLFGEHSPFYTGDVITTRDYKIRSIRNSFGNSELRYKVHIPLKINEASINVLFSLADRSENQFPVLIGKRTIQGRFLVDVSRNDIKKNFNVLVLDVKSVDSVKGFFSKIGSENKRLNITVAKFDDLIFHIDKKVSVKLRSSSKDLTHFDFVFFKSVVEERDAAVALAHYLNDKGIQFMDKAIYYYPLNNKLAQYVRLAGSGINVPTSLFSDWRQDKKAYSTIKKEIGVPFIFKDIRESKGRSNFLVKNKKQFQKILRTNQAGSFIAQKYIQNEGDYRMVLFGKRIELVIHRFNQSAKSHLNNTSAGGTATLIDETQMPGEVRANSIKAAGLLKLDVAGVDMMQDSLTGIWYCLEVQHGPQITSGSNVKAKRKAFTEFLSRKLMDV